MKEEAAFGGDLLGGYSFHDVSESIPEDDEDYSSTDGTYYSEELEAITNQIESANKDNDDGETTDDSFANDSYDEDGFYEQDDLDRHSHRSRDELGRSYQTRGSSILDMEEFGDFASFRSRSQGSSDRKTSRSQDSHDRNSESYSESDNESKRTRSFSSNSDETDEQDETTSKIRKRSKSSESKERLGSDWGDSEESDSASSSSEEIVTVSDHDESRSKEGGDSQSGGSFHFSSQWGSFGNLNEREPTIVSGDTFPSTMESKHNDRPFSSKDDKDTNTTRNEAFANTFDDDPFGGDPFSMAQEAPKSEKDAVSDSQEMALAEKTQTKDDVPPKSSVLDNGADNFTTFNNLQFQDDFFTNNTADFGDEDQKVEGSGDESKRLFPEDPARNDDLDDDNTKSNNGKNKFGDEETQRVASSSDGSTGDVDNAISPEPPLDENEVSSSSNSTREHPGSLEKQTDADWKKDKEENRPFESSTSSKSSRNGSVQESMSFRQKLDSDQNFQDMVSAGSIYQERCDSRSAGSSADSTGSEREEDYLWRESEESSSSSYFENVNFGGNSIKDHRSDSDPFDQRSNLSTTSGKFSIDSNDLDEEPQGVSFDASDTFASTSPKNEAVVDTSSSSKNFISNSPVDTTKELLRASFDDYDEQSSAKDPLHSIHEVADSTFKHGTRQESESPFEQTDKSLNNLIFDGVDETSKSFNRASLDTSEMSDETSPKPTKDRRDDSGYSASGSFCYSDSKLMTADVNESKNPSIQISDSVGTEFLAPFEDSKHSNGGVDESFHSTSDDEEKLLEEERKSAISCSTSNGYSEVRSFEDGAISSWNSDFDASKQSASDSSFHDSELSKSLRLEAQESFNPFFDNSDQSQSASVQKEAQESLYTEVDKNDIDDKSSSDAEEVVASHQDSSFYDDSHLSTSLRGDTNESCSISASGFDSSELSRSLRVETVESVNPALEDPIGQVSRLNNEKSKSSGAESIESPDDLKDESWDAAFDTSGVLKSNTKNEVKTAHSFSTCSSENESPMSVEGKVSAQESLEDDADESKYSSSSYDSHKDFRSRSQNKRTVDESVNSAFDLSRSESLGDRSSEALQPTFHTFEDSISKPIDQAPNQSPQVKTESGATPDQSANSVPSEKSRLLYSDGMITDQNNSSSSRQSEQKRDSFFSNRKPQSDVEKDSNSVNNEPGEISEVSIMIGDVFGDPDELFEDFSKRDRSSKSAGLADYIIQRKEQKDLILSEVKENELSDGNKSKASKVKVDNKWSKQNEKTKRNKITKEISEKEKRGKKRRRKERRRRKKEAKSPALLDFATNVNDAILDLEDRSESKQNVDSSANSLLHGFDALLGIFLQLSDEVELIATFSELNKNDSGSRVHVGALTAILDFAETFDQLFSDLKPIIFESLEDEEPDEYTEDIFDRLDALVDLLCETTYRVGERQEWNSRAETTYVTLLELIERDTLDLRCYFDDITTPDPGISANVHEAWSATGHIEELKALQVNTDPQIFRQICYEVMVSTDQWCPDRDTLMEICDIDPEMLREGPPSKEMDEEDLAPIPQAAEHVLDKVNGETLRRLDVFASVLRRILPPHAVTDASIRSRFTSIRNSIDSPLGLSATNVVSISSVPESINDPDALGVAGVGKTTLAAMVAEHHDVRRYFIDGVAWIYLGDEELNYNRYTQCLRELVAQLDFYDGIPLFAELLHTPGENPSKRKRREEGFMIYARDTIAGLLEDRSVLIILDDVCFEPDMDWFDFAPMPDESRNSQGENCALVITTRRRSLLPAADTVEIDMLDEADAITLLIQESGQLSQTLMAESKEARSVVRECANHPLAVKSIGRWLNLKHATAGVVSSVEEIHSEVIKSMDKILNTGDTTGTDMMYEILSTSLSPAINGGPTNIIKFCFAAFIMVFCDRNHISEFELTEPTPIIPMDIAELLFQTLLEMYEVSLLKKGSLFYAQKKEAAVLIPEALSALGVLKVITYSDTEEEDTDDEQKFLQVMHSIHHEYGVYLANDDRSLKDFTKDAERQWNRALVDAYLSRVREWDWDLDDAAHCYALEMIVSHMIRGKMYAAAATLLTERSFIRGRLKSLGRENCTKRYIKDCELLFKTLKERGPRDPKLRAQRVMKRAYQGLGRELTINVEKNTQDARVKNVEVARAHYEIGFSLAENRCWDAAIVHWETSQELLLLALGPVEVVAGILFNIGVVYSELNEYDQSLNTLKQCLKIRATIHGEEHVLYAQTIQKIGDVLLNMSDYKEAMESYNWALDVMYREPDHHFIEIGEILDNKGKIHYSKGQVDEALQCHQEALRSKQQDLGEDHPELAETFHHIGNCLSDEGNIDDAIVHFDEAVRLKELDPDGGPENDADVLTIEGILNNLEGNQKQGLECYERALQILVSKVPHRKEKIASLLHLIGCVYLMSGEQTKAMKLFKESLKARRKVLGFIHLDVASTLFNMAFLHQTRSRFDKALRCLEEALKIRQLRLPESEKVAVTHEKIGSLARGMGKAKKAQIAFEEALKIRKSIHGQVHEAVASVLQELGDLMDDLGEYESAMVFYVDALEIRRNRLGDDDIAVAETLYSMGYTWHNNEEPDRALACFVEALSIRRFHIGEDSIEVGDTLNMMGFLKAKRGELDDALTLLWDALRIRKLQDDHIKVSETLKNIGNVHREKEELELALECYEESLRIRRLILGHDHEKVADILVAIGNAYGENPLHAQQAKKAFQEAIEIRERVFGEHDENVGVVLRYMGKIEYRANNYNKARNLLTRFVKIRRDNGTHNDGDYVNALLMLGNIQKEKANEIEAKNYWNEAYQVFQEHSLAETNPKIAAAMQHMTEEGKIDIIKNSSGLSQTNKTKSLFGIVTEILVKKEKSDDDSLYQNGRKSMRRKGKGFKL